MRKFMQFCFLTLVFILVIYGYLHAKESSADINSLKGVVPFTTVGGLMGFFDQNDGKVYIYDGNLENCVFAAQLEELGKPMKKLR